MEELKKAKLDHPGAPPDSELPQQPFGKAGRNKLELYALFWSLRTKYACGVLLLFIHSLTNYISDENFHSM